jgi:hypothetical protein
MTDSEVRVLLIREAFDADLADYRAPDDFPERARLGALQRARRSRRRRAGLAAVALASTAAAAAASVIAIGGQGTLAPQAGPASPRAGFPRLASPTAPSSPASNAAGLPSPQSVGKAMLTAEDGVSGDILYSTQAGTNHGAVLDTYQDWYWPAQPAPGQQARWRDASSERYPRGRRLEPAENTAVGYIYRGPGPYHPPRKVSGQVILVCYAGNPFGGCGFGNVDVPSGTWAEFPLPSVSSGLASDLSTGSPFSPAAIAKGISEGQWRVEQRVQLDGRQALVLSETNGGPLAPPILLWVDAQTYLPLKYVWGTRANFASGTFAYLPPTPANLALLNVRIPSGYPRSDAGNG